MSDKLKNKLKNVWKQITKEKPIQSQENKPYDRDVSGVESAYHNRKKPSIYQNILKVKDSYTYGYMDALYGKSKEGDNKIMTHSDRKIKSKKKK
tara:strand:- start:855 stop:1136 length:282 start_codon:yes stop_codon:yes gene_type:complete